MNLRDRRQMEAANAFLATPDRRSIINACPRFGKIKVAIEVMKAMGVKRPLILAPRRDIEKGWADDFLKFGVVDEISYGFSTFASLGKFTYESRDFLIIDEPHEISVNQQKKAKDIVEKLPTLGLTGTLTQKTRNELYDNLNLDVCYKYSIDKGVEEGILADYQLIIHQVPLDNKLKRYGAKNQYTEKAYFNVISNIKRQTDNPMTAHHMNLKLINIIQNSLGKSYKTLELLQQFKNERVLVFCGVTWIADSLNVSVYHSKKKDKQIFDNFCAGQGVDHLATIKMMQAGITIVPINKGIINYMSGNPEDSAQKICRFLGLEYDNPDKKAEIHIISSNESFEIERLKTGLAFFDSNKITIKN